MAQALPFLLALACLALGAGSRLTSDEPPQRRERSHSRSRPRSQSLPRSALRVLPSHGCGAADERPRRHWSRWVNLTVHDFEDVKRSFFVEFIPGQVHGPTPALFSIHGQGDFAYKYVEERDYVKVMKSVEVDHGLVVIYPQGINDHGSSSDQGTGWNSGDAGDNSTCITNMKSDATSCYTSCKKLGKCGRCNWSTCYDDRLFIREVLDWISDNMCLDLNRIYLTGESNGGQLVNYVFQEMPEVWAAVGTWYGLPLLGKWAVAQAKLIRAAIQGVQVGFVSFHGRQDTCIPPGGGQSDDGWLFESEESWMGLQAALNGCGGIPKRLHTPWSGGSLRLECIEYPECTSGHRVVRCYYNEGHGVWPEDRRGEQLMLWHLFQHHRRHNGVLQVL